MGSFGIRPFSITAYAAALNGACGYLAGENDGPEEREVDEESAVCLEALTCASSTACRAQMHEDSQATDTESDSL